LVDLNADFVVGGVARNEDYFFYRTFVDDLWDSLKQDNILLLAPRRTGKTSIMYHLLDHPKHNFRVIHLNVEDLDKASDFFLSLIDAINEHQPQYMKKLSRSWDLFKKLGSHLEEVTILDFKIKLRKSADWEKDWQEVAHQLMEKVNDVNEPVLFIIDELPDMLTAMVERDCNEDCNELRSFLHLFRKMRIDYHTGESIRWLVGGSVNIRGTLDELGLLKSINDLKTESLPPISEHELTDFVDKMLHGRGVEFDDTLIPRMQSLLGEPIPFFLQLFTQELYRYWRREKPVILTACHADIVFQHALLGEAAHDKLQHYHSRIQLYYPAEEQEAAYTLLDILARSDDGVSEKGLFSQYQHFRETQSGFMNISVVQMQQEFKRLLLRLESDFYISKIMNDRRDFNSFLLKTWWRKNWVL